MRMAFPVLLAPTDNPRSSILLTTFYNRVRVAVAAAPGTGVIMLGAATANNFLTFVEAGVQDSALVNLICEDGFDVQCLQVRYNSLQNSCTILQVYFSKIGGVLTQNRMNLSINTVVYIDVLAKDISSYGKRPLRQVFSGSGVWFKPLGFSAGAMALIECWGGGGGGGLSSTPNDAAGGGGGAYKFLWVLLVELGASELVSIGAGGFGAAGASLGGSGGSTLFGSRVIAYGGRGGDQDLGSGPGPGGGSFSTGGASPPFSPFDGGSGAANSGPAAAAIFGGGGGAAAAIGAVAGISQSASNGATAVQGFPSAPGFAGGGASSLTVNTAGGPGGPGRAVITIFDGDG